jgi:hypothetical protein
MNPGTDGRAYRRHSAIGRLNSWMSTIGVQHYSFVNVFDRPGAFKKSQVDLSFLARTILLSDNALIVALGNTASEVLLKISARHLKIPHPSYQNRKFNHPDAEKSVIDTLRSHIYN